MGVDKRDKENKEKNYTQYTPYKCGQTIGINSSHQHILEQHPVKDIEQTSLL